MNLSAELTQLLAGLKKQIQTESIFSVIGRIEKFDGEKMRADVLPLLYIEKETEKVPFSVVPSVPVQFLYAGGYYIRPEYKKGDLVWLSYATFPIENQLKNKSESTDTMTNPGNSLSVVQGLAPSTFSAPAEFAEPGMIIGHESGNAYLAFGTDAFLFKYGTTEILLGSEGITLSIGTTTVSLSATGVTATIAGMKYDLVTHKHPTATPGPPSPPIPEAG